MLIVLKLVFAQLVINLFKKIYSASGKAFAVKNVFQEFPACCVVKLFLAALVFIKKIVLFVVENALLLLIEHYKVKKNGKL